MSDKTSPRPWSVGVEPDDGDGWQYAGTVLAAVPAEDIAEADAGGHPAEPFIVADVTVLSDAQQIVRAVNAFPALVAACEAALTLPLADALGLAGGIYVEQLILDALKAARGE